MVKFCKDGSDATSGAVKLARAYTGRDLIAICADHPFFSVDDWFIGTTPMNAGIPEAVAAADGDVPLQRHRQREGAVRAASRARSPPASSRPRAPTSRATASCTSCSGSCHANGALLILDEMITGFRWHNGGAQKVYDIVPDLSCLGQGAGQRLLRLGAGRQARVHAPRRPRPRRQAARVPAVDDARRGDARAGRRNRDHARSTATSR